MVPLSLAVHLIEQNVCGVVTAVDGIVATVAGLCGDIPSVVAQVASGIATAPVTNSDATLTSDASREYHIPKFSRHYRSPNTDCCVDLVTPKL